MSFLNKLTFIIFLFILCVSSKSIFAQNNLSRELTSVIKASKKQQSVVIWERIPLPEGKEIRSIKTMPENKFYIGCKNGGVYQLVNNQWELVGLPTKDIKKIEEYLNGELLVSSDSIYIWDYEGWTKTQKPFYGNVTKTFDFFFGGGSYEELYRSSDGCYSWDYVLDFSGCETVGGIVATSPDSIFIGYRNWCEYGKGGVYLSIDSGYNWNPFGLHSHFISTMAIDKLNQVYAGNAGHYDTGQGGLYKYNYQTEIWDTIIYFPYITSIEFNTENHIFLGYFIDGASDRGGVMHSEDGGESWILDTIGMGSTWVRDIQIADNGILYALTGYTTKKLYRTVLPVEINENTESFHYKTTCYPNPASNKITITSLKKCKDRKPMYLNIYNTAGFEILHYKISNQELSNGFFELDLSDLERGEYIYRIKCENYITSNKFIIQ